jgi:hypothetical protein
MGYPIFCRLATPLCRSNVVSDLLPKNGGEYKIPMPITIKKGRPTIQRIYSSWGTKMFIGKSQTIVALSLRRVDSLTG